MKSKKKIKAVLYVILGALLVAVTVIALTFLSGNRVTVARCIVTENGSLYMVYDGRPVQLNYEGNVDCKTGDRLFIVHSTAFAESWPEQTRAVLVIKLSRGDESDVPENAFDIFSETENVSDQSISNTGMEPGTASSNINIIPIKEYDKTPIVRITFKKIKYLGGGVNEYVVDFENDVIKKAQYIGSKVEDPEFGILADFSAAQEAVLINKLYSYGLFDLDDNYPSPEGIFDGGEWLLSIEYSGGTAKNSKGINNTPTKVFGECAKAFFDICHDGVVGDVPSEYYYPPSVYYALRFENNLCCSSFYPSINYRWNGFEGVGNGIYAEAGRDISYSEMLVEGKEYTMSVGVDRDDGKERFEKIIVTSYDFNKELTNKKTVCESDDESRIEFRLDLNKIYVVRVEYENGDFAEYAFNTMPWTADEE